MNRVIKFRAWDGDKMHNDVSPWRWDFVISNTWHRCEKATGNGILGEGGHYAEMLVPAIRYKEIMQFTGLTDKHGVEVYDGDVVEDFSGNKGVIKWGVWGWLIDFKIETFDLDGIDDYGTVIGNIFENPELIK